MTGQFIEADISWFMQLPNELLREIFSYLIVSPGFSHTIKDSYRRDFFTLRSVCRTFRALVNELDFWWDEEFELVALLPYDHKLYSAEIELRHGNFLTELLEDRQLIEWLGRRPSWRFTNMTSFRTVYTLVHSFRDTITSIVFEGAINTPLVDGWRGSLRTGIQALANCPNLTSLKIWGCPDEPYDLDLINDCVRVFNPLLCGT
jgi:hypothetical protein